MAVYLYVKQHAITGLKYFGKSRKKHPNVYHGSGIYWRRHIKRHGIEHVNTLEIWHFEDLDECKAFALNFSIMHDIVKSPEWANLKNENGLDGGSDKTGKALTPEHKEAISKALKGRVTTVEHRMNLSKSLTGKTFSEEHCRKISERNRGTGNGNYRREYSAEERQRLSEARIGKKHSEETKKKQSIARQGAGNPFHGRKHSEETKRKMSEAAKLARQRRKPISDQ